MFALHCLGAFILLQIFMPGGSVKNRIIGGKESDPHSHPYMVYLLNVITNETCDGFLVDKDFVMTAAHCGVPILAMIGLHNVFKHLPENMYLIEKYYQHPDYDNKNFENDIMLLKLSKSAIFSEVVKPVAMPKSENEIFTRHCMVLGWGCQTYTNEFPSTVLQEVNITLGSNSSVCTTPGFICSEGFTGPGKGDSGGPLVCGNVAHGIVSNNYESKNGYVSRYIRIGYYLNWIQSVIDGTYKAH
ncbi:mast cell protease 2 [Hoplias malabaricus]|uniref:mast cell protease 2 n=1 Tax=Hoplias malabaricus TaxID=27720 RepID=UPI003461AFFC